MGTGNFVQRIPEILLSKDFLHLVVSHSYEWQERNVLIPVVSI